MTLGFVCTPTCRGTAPGVFLSVAAKDGRENSERGKNPPTGHAIIRPAPALRRVADRRRARRRRSPAPPLDDGLARRRGAPLGMSVCVASRSSKETASSSLKWNMFVMDR